MNSIVISRDLTRAFRAMRAWQQPLAAFVALVAASVASAFTAPAVGDFAYDAYDIVVNQILNGPIGFIGGVLLIVWGVTRIMTNWMMAILCIIAGSVLVRAADLVVTLGFTI